MAAMWRATFLATAVLPLAAVAQTPPAPPHVTPLTGGAIFVSPMGEPFHSEDNLSGAEHWFTQADTNHDGRLTLAEFHADAWRFFKRLDTDHNGVIDPAEIEHYETVIAPEIGVMNTGGIPTEIDSDGNAKFPPYPDRLGAGRFSYIDLPEPIAAMDTNFDRGISAKEYDFAMQRRFTALDSNGDGALTRDELPRLTNEDEGPKVKKKKH